MHLVKTSLAITLDFENPDEWPRVGCGQRGCARTLFLLDTRYVRSQEGTKHLSGLHDLSSSCFSSPRPFFPGNQSVRNCPGCPARHFGDLVLLPHTFSPYFGITVSYINKKNKKIKKLNSEVLHRHDLEFSPTRSGPRVDGLTITEPHLHQTPGTGRNCRQGRGCTCQWLRRECRATREPSSGSCGASDGLLPKA